MKISWGFRTTAALAGCLVLPLWLGSCTIAEERGAAGVSAGSAGGPVRAPAPQSQPAPAPQAQSAPTPVTPSSSASGAAASPVQSSPSAGTGGSAPPEPPPGGANAQTQATAVPVPSQAPGLPAADPPRPPEPVGTSTGTSVYYVSLDDGGTGGVRFGCNDSLVAVPLAAPLPGEPLQASLRALLPGSPDGSTPTPDGLYNALASSTLAFESGYFDGATVVVYLSGALRPGGTCDIPRIEAQLTHTAVAAVSATRAEIYINGRSLSEVLSLR